ncbi:shikimate dehydrogenase [Heyndrickxia shackletonii]|uniref:Shikimate dehydrogenase (NADP(+)) n=1 Tax=Heyndrickxia shackletonii TaxID=157838 RepID=A0A0Q3WXF9_9BACI|nr:shikimate dehydrogenase [Heyndrickxia shackletonii]KQL53479.1 shikimate dehydrogenase [Heyndrickxia shackletonii]NEY99550.1 shikimate dehydrogenase [Heyndrickxia shackletonii]
MKRLFGVIGDPISHSMSPMMHNDAFKNLKIDGYYQPFRITPEDLATAIKGMKVIGIEGFNVTIPHKTSILPLVDRLDPLAKAIGAVNTVVRDGNDYVGYNSDGLGFIRSLQERWKKDFKNEKTLIIGAGGAAKAIYYSLASVGVKKIDICNRTTARAQGLVDHCPFKCETNILDFPQARQNLGAYTLVIQTTSIGMSPNINEIPFSLENMLPNTHAVDIIYNPLETKFLTEARQKGATTQNGIGMFVHQGAIAFEKWTGIKPDIIRMENIVMQHLGG